MPGTVRRRIPAVHPDSVTTGRRRFSIPRPQAAPRPKSRTAFAAASGYCPLRLQPPLAPVSARECRPRFPRTGKDPHASAKPTPSVLSHEFPVFTPMLRRPICLLPSGNAARPLRNRKPNPIPDPSPASPDAPGPCIPADSAGRPDPMSPPEARTTRKRPPKDTNSSIYQLIRLKFAGGGEIAIFVQQNPTEEFKPFVGVKTKCDKPEESNKPVNTV